MGPIRTIIVEDIDDTRRRLFDDIAQDTRVSCVGQARNVAEGMALIARHAIDVALIDLGLPDGSGLQLIRYLSDTQPEADAMVISVFGEEETVIRAIEAGATGYLIKGSLELNLVESIIQLREGGSPISPLIARRLLKRFTVTEGTPAVAVPTIVHDEGDRLTERELDVLRLVAQGFVVVEIAQRLHISPHTVSTHVKRTYRKLQVRSRGQAVSEAIKRGLI
jgi:DNA-binding NarL/FixJ family response regulator